MCVVEGRRGREGFGGREKIQKKLWAKWWCVDSSFWVKKEKMGDCVFVENVLLAIRFLCVHTAKRWNGTRWWLHIGVNVCVCGLKIRRKKRIVFYKNVHKLWKWWNDLLEGVCGEKGTTRNEEYEEKSMHPQWIIFLIIIVMLKALGVKSVCLQCKAYIHACIECRADGDIRESIIKKLWVGRERAYTL